MYLVRWFILTPSRSSSIVIVIGQLQGHRMTSSGVEKLKRGWEKQTAIGKCKQETVS